MTNTTLCGKILQFVVKHSFLLYNITLLCYFVVLLWYICDNLWYICGIFVVYLWYICGIFVVYLWYIRGIFVVYSWYLLQWDVTIAKGICLIERIIIVLILYENTLCLVPYLNLIVCIRVGYFGGMFYV